ncbi:hypothetical protein K4K61_012405 [Colletotrichum sp. SAR11_59]|nr:hypothetical protein K4K61_012405 [Colletotrichum sp. SAR11_59]
MARELRKHHALLESLYIKQDMKIQQVIAYMKSEHSITAGNSTYERLFREWGLSKIKKGENWAWVDHRMRKRHGDGRKSALYIQDRRIPMNEIQKEISRHVTTLQQAYLSARAAPSPCTPKGYRIETPASAISGGTPVGAVSTPASQPPTPVADQWEPDDTSSPVGFDAIDIVERPEAATGSTPEIDLQDKTMIVETLQSCGAFIRIWGSSGRSMSHQKIHELYEAIAHGLLIAAQTSKEYAIPIEMTTFTTGFNILLGTYRIDCDSVRGDVAHVDKSEYEDVFRAALFLAVRKGVLDLVEILWGVFGTKNPKNNDGETCLHISSIHNQPRVVEFLLSRNVDVNARSRNGRTPWTAIGGSASHEDVSKLLIQAGACINDTRPDLMNSLYECAAGGHTEAVRTLLRRGADPSFQTPYRWAPLHFAKTVEIIQLLVDAGADVNAVSDTGRTPLDVHFNNQPKKQCLIDHGARTSKDLQRRPWAHQLPPPPQEMGPPRTGLQMTRTPEQPSFSAVQTAGVQGSTTSMFSPSLQRSIPMTSSLSPIVSVTMMGSQEPYHTREASVFTSQSWSSEMATRPIRSFSVLFQSEINIQEYERGIDEEHDSPGGSEQSSSRLLMTPEMTGFHI